MAVKDWSTSAGSNLSVAGVNIAPGMARSDVDNALRGMMAELKAKFNEGLSVTDFGATGDGITDDTAAFVAALAAVPAGGTLELAANSTYLISQTLVLTKPIVIRGGAKESTKLLFSSSGTYLASPYKCGILAPHSTTVVPSYSGNAVRSVLSGFTVEMQAGPTLMDGIKICTPVYVYEVDAKSFSRDGFAVDADNTSGVIGNANGTSFTNCLGIFNGRHGFYFNGNNANACVALGCRTFENVGYGFYDNSFLGNSYFGCETDHNTAGGYFCTEVTQNRSIYVGCYAETNQSPMWNVGKYTIRIGAQNAPGADDSLTGIGFSAIPRGDGFFSKPVILAGTDTIAEALSGGPYVRVSKSEIEYLAATASKKIKFSGILSANYTDITSDGTAAIRFPNSAVTGNISIARPYMPQGASFGANSAIIGSGTAAPVSGTYANGAILLHETPAASGFIGWVCTTGGTPGTWKTFGAISA